MSEDPLRLTEMSDPPPELVALVRRMEGPPPMPPELPGLLARTRPRLRIVGPTLAMMVIAVGGYLVYRMIDAPPPPERIERAVESVEAPAPPPRTPPPSTPPPSTPPPVITAAVVEPPPPRPDVAPAPMPRPRPSRQEPVRAATVAQGRLMIQTLPWAHVFVDGQDTGLTTPARLSVDAGRHTIGLRTEDGVMHAVAVSVVAGETIRVARQLGPGAPRRPREPTISPFLPPPEARPEPSSGEPIRR